MVIIAAPATPANQPTAAPATLQKKKPVPAAAITAATKIVAKTARKHVAKMLRYH